MDNINFDKTVRINDNGLAEFAFGESLTNGFPGVTVSDYESAIRRGAFKSFDAQFYVGTATTPETNNSIASEYLQIGDTVFAYIAIRFLGGVTGTGPFYFKYPVPPYIGLNTSTSYPVDGWAHGFDLNTSTSQSFALRGNAVSSTIAGGAAHFSLYTVNNYVANNNPWTWAINDTLGITFSYRVAST